MTVLSRRELAAGVGVVLVALGTIIAIWPEPPARLLLANENWTATGVSGRFTVDRFPVRFNQLRRSIVASGSAVSRSWTPDRGIQQFEAISPPFKATSEMSVVVTGTSRTATGGHRVFLSCSSHPQEVDVFLGNVNVNLSEAIVRLSPAWCPDQARLHIVARDKVANIGVGSVFAISRVSAWKSSFLGLLPYLAVALLIPGAIALMSAALAVRYAPAWPAVPAALASIGVAALAAFFVSTLLPRGFSFLLPVFVLLAVSAGMWVAGRAAVATAAQGLAPSAAAWGAAAFTLFALLSAADNGLGHWAPNYRFWPAAWSSDNELPWLFAEAVRNQMDLAGSLGGQWMPTDRPPLMTGAHLLVAEVFAWLQSANDGTYLRGLAFNAAALAFSALWVPAALFLLEAMLGLPRRRAAAVVMVVALLPFAVFNTIYGWPKALGAAFGLAALVMAALAVRPESKSTNRFSVVAFGVLGALSILSHGSGVLFLLPIAIWLCIAMIRKEPRALLLSAVLGTAMMLVWTLYQRLVLPSHGPLTKFALTGDFGFANRSRSLLEMLAERYAALSLSQWLDVKWRMLLQPLFPIDHPVSQMFRSHLNVDFGADVLGSLRQWDFFLLSGGNIPILIAAAALIVARAHRGAARPPRGLEPIDTAAIYCVGLGLAVWGMLVVAFLAPIVVHHWPYAAVFTPACAALGWTSVRRPTLFRGLAVATLVYTGLVWIFGALREARAIDLVALTAFALAASWLVLRHARGFWEGEDRWGAEHPVDKEAGRPGERGAFLPHVPEAARTSKPATSPNIAPPSEGKID